MKTRLGVLMAGFGLAMSAVPAMAHHSFAAEFDANKKVNLAGTVTKVEWLNPHIWIYMDAKDESGKITKWQCEGGAPNSLVRNGWTRDALKAGDSVTISGSLAKDATNTCNASQVKLPDGRRVFAGSSENEGGGNSKGGGKQ
jgi:uncharacterized protein DUF6152